jgi:NAD(P)-dependent dehydrogenase (short-subunit alcohol dehydrogenase family)
VTAPADVPDDPFRLDASIALVTGASRNIGAAVSQQLAAAGADVVMIARDQGRLDEVAGTIRATHPDRRILTRAADVAVREQVEGVLAWLDAEVGTVDVVVNNAASTGVPGGGKSAIDFTDDDWNEVWQTNVLAPWRLSAGVARRLQDRKRPGAVINVLSGAGLQPVPGKLDYGTTKAALWMMTRYLAAEWAPLIRVNAIVPGLVTENGEPRTAGQQRLLANVPFGRVGHPSEIAPAAVYLASRAASYTTGTMLVCNGGRPW